MGEERWKVGSQEDWVDVTKFCLQFGVGLKFHADMEEATVLEFADMA